VTSLWSRWAISDVESYVSWRILMSNEDWLHQIARVRRELGFPEQDGASSPFQPPAHSPASSPLSERPSRSHEPKAHNLKPDFASRFLAAQRPAEPSRPSEVPQSAPGQPSGPIETDEDDDLPFGGPPEPLPPEAEKRLRAAQVKHHQFVRGYGLPYAGSAVVEGDTKRRQDRCYQCKARVDNHRHALCPTCAIRSIVCPKAL